MCGGRHEGKHGNPVTRQHHMWTRGHRELPSPSECLTSGRLCLGPLRRSQITSVSNLFLSFSGLLVCDWHFTDEEASPESQRTYDLTRRQGLYLVFLNPCFVLKQSDSDKLEAVKRTLYNIHTS